MAQTQKAYAWSAAKAYAEIDPHQLADMPRLLTDAMQKRLDDGAKNGV